MSSSHLLNIFSKFIRLYDLIILNLQFILTVGKFLEGGVQIMIRVNNQGHIITKPLSDEQFEYCSHQSRRRKLDFLQAAVIHQLELGTSLLNGKGKIKSTKSPLSLFRSQNQAKFTLNLDQFRLYFDILSKTKSQLKLFYGLVH